MELDKEQDKRYSEEDGIYEYDDGDICIISPRPITQESIDLAKQHSKEGIIERLKKNPNEFTEYCGDTPISKYINLREE